MLPITILAGGLATRLRPLTETIPKALVEIGGEPFLARQLRLLARSGASRIVLCIGYRGEMIRDFAGDGSAFGLSIEYSSDGPTLLGTAGAIRRALPLLGGSFFVLYGDSYLPCDYRAVERAFRKSARSGLMTVYRNEGRFDGSNIDFADGRIVAYDKRHPTPAMRHIDYGLGAFKSDVFAALPENQFHDLASVYQTLLQRGDLAGFEAHERFYEIGSPRGIEELEDYVRHSRRAVFLDRDGVLNEALVKDRRPYPPSSLADLKIVPGAREALHRLKSAGFLLIVVTNQPDVGRGTTSAESVEEMNDVIRSELPLDAFYVCFHDGSENCDCRKPNPGLLRRAAHEWNIDLKQSFMVGDRWRDIDAGAAAGCRTVQVDYGYDERAPENPPSHRTPSITEGAQWILAQVRLSERVTL